MSSPEGSARRHGRRIGSAAVLLAGLVALAGCTVQPLYGTGSGLSGTADSGLSTELSSIVVAPVATREALEVRNHLIFLLTGGAGQPPSPRYTLTLGVVSSAAAAAQIQVGREDEPTANIVTMISNYTLVENATGRPVANGVRQTTASYDVPRQQFAELRARRDAENRAARELAEFLRHALAQDLSRLPAS